MRLNYFARSVLFLAHCAVDVDWVPIDVTFSQFDFLSVRNEFSQCHKRKLEPRAAMMSAEPPRRTNRIEIEPGCRIGHELLNNLHSKWFNWTTVAIKLDMKINRQFPVGCTPRMRSEIEMKRLADEWTRMRRHWERQTNMIDCLMFIVYLRGHTLLTYRCMAAFDVSLGSYYVCAFEAFNAWVGAALHSVHKMLTYIWQTFYEWMFGPAVIFPISISGYLWDLCWFLGSSAVGKHRQFAVECCESEAMKMLPEHPIKMLQDPIRLTVAQSFNSIVHKFINNLLHFQMIGRFPRTPQYHRSWLVP